MRHTHIILFATTLIILTTGIIYVARRTAFCLSIPYALTTSIFIILFISVIAILSSNTYVKGTTPVAHCLTIYGCYMGGFLLYLLLATLLIHLIGTIAGISPLWQGIATYGVTLALYAWSIFATAHITTPHIKIPINGDIKIAHLSDMHIGHFRGKRWVEKVVSTVNREKPDVVVITGDIYESFYNLSTDVIEPLKDLQAPVYFVTGNHDGYVNIPRIKSMLTEIGVTVLEDSLAECKGVQFIGVAYNSTPEIAMRHVDIDKNKPTVMLYHFPKGVETEVDLVLSGHTHGGQFFPLTLINHFAFQYNSGLHKHKDTYIYTSDGVGTTGPPLRLGTFAEIPIIELT